MLLLVRHGETAPNVEGLLLGRADPPLTERGEAQARALAAVLPRPDIVVCSPLGRAVATAAAFSSHVEVDERWIELDYGGLDGVHPAGSLTTSGTVARDPTFAPPAASRWSSSAGGCVRRAMGWPSGRRIPWWWS